MLKILENATEFIWKNARLLERRRFTYHFQNGSRDAVRSAILAYQNADGGFGNALEPDIRCPDSQPVPIQHAFEFLDDAGFALGDLPEVIQACDYLQTVTTEAGGVPWLLPSAMSYPRAPWWQCEKNVPASLNPTAAIVGLLHKHQVDHPWLGRATDYCWQAIDTLEPTEFHTMGTVLTFLFNVPDRSRADALISQMVNGMRAAGLIADNSADGYVRKALDWAPRPDHPLRPYMRQSDIDANLEALIAGQQEDGGWTIPWPALSEGCNTEWRGWITVHALITIKLNTK